MKKTALLLSVTALLTVTAQAEVDANAVMTTKCGICHEVYDPANYEKEAWDTYADQMGLIAQLSAEEIQALKDIKQ